MRYFAEEFLRAGPLLVLASLLCAWPFVAFAYVLDGRFGDAFIVLVAMYVTGICAFVARQQGHPLPDDDDLAALEAGYRLVECPKAGEVPRPACEWPNLQTPPHPED